MPTSPCTCTPTVAYMRIQPRRAINMHSGIIPMAWAVLAAAAARRAQAAKLC